jgi:uncharacterized protein YegJ (DUF2314 family)
MRIFVIAGAAIAVVCVAAVQVANSKLDQPRARAAEANKAVPQSADDRRIVSDNVVAYATKNAELLEARQKARETLPRFVDLLNSGMKATFSVKFPLTQNGKTEHIWLQVAGIKDDAFIGMLANTPVNGTNYKLGQVMTVASKDVEDWMVRTQDQIYGGYTARYQIKDLPKAQQEKLAGMFRD